MKKTMRGGFDIPGFPLANILAQYRITDATISAAYTRPVITQMDCVINMLEIIGVLDQVTANIIRVTSTGRVGIFGEEIEKIFILKEGHNYSFRQTVLNGGALFEHLNQDHAAICGYPGHVFMIAKQGDKLYYIDPQVPFPSTPCDLMNAECLALINRQPHFYVLFRSEERLTPDQLRHIGFSIAPAPAPAPPGGVPMVY